MKTMFLLGIMFLFFGGTVNAQTPPATQAANSGTCKLAFLDAKQVGVTRLINIETGKDEGTIPTDGLISPKGGLALRFIKQDGQTRLAVEQYVGLGRQYIMTAIEGDVVRAAWSPDGTQVAVIMKQDKRQNLYVVNAAGTKLTRLTEWDQADDYPVWTDAKNIQFGSSKNGNTWLYSIATETAAKPKVILDKAFNSPFVVINQEGLTLFGATEGGKARLQFVKPGTDAPVIVTNTDKPITEMALEPDSGVIALVVGGDLYTMNDDGSGFKAIVGNPSGSQLAWLCGEIGASNPRRR
jgi:hypothetical protein